MGETRARRTVGVLNSTEDVIGMLQALLHDEGYTTSAAYISDFKRGRQDMGAWLANLGPTAILYDIPPPYEENWAFYQELRRHPAAREHRFIITTTNLRVLEDLVGPVEAVEFIGKPFDLEEILNRVARALAAIDRGEADTGRVSAESQANR
jgi:DNA-binding response OmpR family regulator